MQRILVPLNRSPLAEVALGEALPLSKLPQTEVTLLEGVPPIEHIIVIGRQDITLDQQNESRRVNKICRPKNACPSTRVRRVL